MQPSLHGLHWVSRLMDKGKLGKDSEMMQFLFSRYDLHDIVAVFSLWHMGCDETWLDGCTGYMSIIMVLTLIINMIRCNNCCDLASASVTFSNFELTHARDSNIPEVVLIDLAFCVNK